MKRREFLQAATAAGCLAPFPGITNLLCAATASDRPLLVVVFLRGGADGLQMVAPSADADYIAGRPPDLRVPETGERAGFVLDNSLDPAAGFRLHSDAAPLVPLYQGGRLAIVHAVGLSDGTRSHFVAQDMMERGIADGKLIGHVDNGWLSRAASAGQPGLLSAFSATTATAFALHGATNALTAPDLANGLGLPWGAATSNLIRNLSSLGGSPAHAAGLKALDRLEAVDRRLPRDTNGKVIPYKAAGKASYEDIGELARALTSVARLARLDVGMTAACVDHGGWDTHEGQPGRFSNQMRQLARGLAAFHEDMAAGGRKVVTVVMTEFGRRLRANRSGGTDHGHGGCWLVLGDGVLGGRMFGKWPGVTTPALDQGVDLAVTTDYRTVLSEALANTGLDTGNAAFPNWKSAGRLGLFDDPQG
jgi:uncharacterized protein (DUF1501 family)